MKGRANISKENCQAGGNGFHKRFIGDSCGCADDWFAARGNVEAFPSPGSLLESPLRDFFMIL